MKTESILETLLGASRAPSKEEIDKYRKKIGVVANRVAGYRLLITQMAESLVPEDRLMEDGERFQDMITQAMATAIQFDLTVRAKAVKLDLIEEDAKLHANDGIIAVQRKSDC